MRTTALNRLIGTLSHPDVSKRRTAAQALGDADGRALYPLIKALGDENPGVQEAAMRSLVSIGGEVAAYMVVPLLREDSYLRNTAILILKELGRASIEFLYPLLGDKDDDVKKFSLDLLADIRDGVVPEKILPLLDEPNANVRAAAIRAVGALGYKGAAGRLARALAEEEWVCFSALETLGELRDESAVDAITGLLGSASGTIRVAALETLGKIGSARAREAIAVVIPKATGAEKSAAVKSLVQIGVPPSMGELGETLVEMFRESDWEGKLIALKGLLALKERKAVRLIVDVAGSLDPSVPGDDEKLLTVKSALREFGCAEEFVGILADPDIRYRGKVIAAEVVGHMGCREAVPALVALYEKHTRDVRRASVRALGNMASEEAESALLRAVSDRDSHIRKEAAAALGARGSRRAVGVLLEQLTREKYADVMEEVVKALLKADPGAVFARLEELPGGIREAIGRFAGDIDILARLVRDRELSVRVAAISGLGNLRDREARDMVLEATRDGDPEVRRTAVMALVEAEADAEAIRPLLSDPDMWVRLHAVRALGKGGRHDMLAVLTPMLEDRETPVVLAAVEAVAMAGGEDASAALRPLRDHPEKAVREAVRDFLERGR